MTIEVIVKDDSGAEVCRETVSATRDELMLPGYSNISLADVARVLTQRITPNYDHGY